MCTNKRWIHNKYNNKDYFVPCGRCPSCLQKKAGKRANRIVNNQKSGMIPLFCHFTYQNDCLPFIKISDISNKIGKQKDITIIERCNEKDCYILPVYRNSVNRRKRIKSDYTTYKTRDLKQVVLDYIPFDCDTINNVNFFELQQPTKFDSEEVVSIIYYKDIQNYIKRLREYVKYHTEIFPSSESRQFEYYICAENGENFSRAHFHALIYVNSNYVAQWKRTIAANWSFDNYDLCYQNVEIAVKPSAYVSTYLNSTIDLPAFFKEKSIRQRTSFNNGFGFGESEFSFEKILKNIKLGTFEYSAKFIDSNGVCSVRPIPYPTYVQNRYFPKFKGLGKLSYNELALVFNSPNRLADYARKCGFESKNDLNKTINFLHKKKQLFDYEFSKLSDEPKIKLCDSFPYFFSDSILKTNIQNDWTSFGFWYVEMLKAKNHSRWQCFYCNQNSTLEQIYSYDNFAQKPFYKDIEYEKNPNFYPLNLVESQKLEEKFYKCNKTHRVNAVKQQYLNQLQKNRYG